MTYARDNLIRIGNRVIDFVLRVDRSEVLNGGSVQQRPENPAAEMMKASKNLLAEGLGTESGKVDYASLKQSEIYAQFRELSNALIDCSPDDIGTGDKATAFWVNIYNALIIDGIIHHDVQGSLLTRPGFFRQIAYDIGGMRFSADAIEHGVLRHNRTNPALPIPMFTSDDPRNHVYDPKFDPRLHFALVCGANSCPPISFYEAETLEQQLNLAAAAFINGSGVRYEDESDSLWLSSIFKWYQMDFGGLDGVLELVQSHLKDGDVSEKIVSGQSRLRYMSYDWSVNRLA